jgi:hypothetical protein
MHGFNNFKILTSCLFKKYYTIFCVVLVHFTLLWYETPF